MNENALNTAGEVFEVLATGANTEGTIMLEPNAEDEATGVD